MSLDMRRLPDACCLVLAAAAPIVAQREAWTRPFPDFGGRVSFKPVSVDKIIADGDLIDLGETRLMVLSASYQLVRTAVSCPGGS